MNPRSLIVLLVVALALGALAWYASQDEGTVSNEVPEGSLLAQLGGEPERIRLKNKDGSKAYVLERRQRGSAWTWMLTDPVVDEAQESQVEMLLGQLAQAERKIGWPDGVVTPKRITEAGLDEPLGRIVVESGEKELEIEFGAECFPVGYRFARVNGEVARIPAGIEGIVEVNRDDLINQMLFSTMGPALRRLELRRRSKDGKEEGLILRRGSNNAFFVKTLDDGAEELPADANKIGTLLVDLLTTRVRRFMPRRTLAPGTPAPQPWMTIVVDGQVGRETVELSDPAEGEVEAIKSYGAGVERPSRMIVDAQSFERLVAEPIDALISTRLWTFGPGAASRIRVENTSKRGEARKVEPPLVLERQGRGDYRLISPQAGPADPRAVNRLVAALETTILRESVPSSNAAAQKALAVPRYRVQLDPPKENPSLGSYDVRIGIGEDGKIFAKRQDDSMIWIVESPDLDALDAPWWKYVESVAFRLGSSTRVVSSIAVVTGGKRTDWEPGEKGWQRGETVDEEFEEAIYEPLRVLKSKEIAGDEPSELLAGLTPLATIRIVSQTDGKERVLQELRLYAEGSKGLLSWRESDLVVHRLFDRTSMRIREFLATLR